MRKDLRLLRLRVGDHAFRERVWSVAIRVSENGRVAVPHGAAGLRRARERRLKLRRRYLELLGHALTERLAQIGVRPIELGEGLPSMRACEARVVELTLARRRGVYEAGRAEARDVRDALAEGVSVVFVRTEHLREIGRAEP